jgi:hypothetical protein
MTEISTIIRACLDEGRAIADEDVRALLNENEKLREALQWLVNDLQNHPMSGGLLVAFDNARAALGEKE